MQIVLKSKNRTNSVAISIPGNDSLGKWKDKKPTETSLILKKKTEKLCSTG